MITTLRKGKRAAAAVELAIITPVLLTMLFGIIEYGWLFTVRQSVVTAAREGARVAALPGSTKPDVELRVNECLEPLGVSEQTTTVELDDDGRPTGKVTVAVPRASVSLVGSYFGDTDGYLKSTCSMKKEGMD